MKLPQHITYKESHFSLFFIKLFQKILEWVRQTFFLCWIKAFFAHFFMLAQIFFRHSHEPSWFLKTITIYAGFVIAYFLYEHRYFWGSSLLKLKIVLCLINSFFNILKQRMERKKKIEVKRGNFVNSATQVEIWDCWRTIKSSIY